MPVSMACLTYNTDHFADNAANPSLWVAFYQPETEQYELIHGESSASDVVVGIASSVISGATVSIASIQSGVGTATLAETDELGNYQAVAGSVTVLNHSETAINASSQEAIALVLLKQSDDFYLVLNVMDFRSGPDFDRTEKQRWIHNENDSTFRLAAECDLDTVTDVLIEGGVLKHKYHTAGNCMEQEDVIANIGACDDAPAAVATTPDPWRETGFWN